jgi:hypothetical protein
MHGVVRERERDAVSGASPGLRWCLPGQDFRQPLRILEVLAGRQTNQRPLAKACFLHLQHPDHHLAHHPHGFHLRPSTVIVWVLMGAILLLSQMHLAFRGLCTTHDLDSSPIPPPSQAQTTKTVIER